jgi:hypothetical protein
MALTLLAANSFSTGDNMDFVEDFTRPIISLLV